MFSFKGDHTFLPCTQVTPYYPIIALNLFLDKDTKIIFLTSFFLDVKHII
jgi:hypothetical protein